MKSYYDIIIQLEVFHDFFPLEEDHVCTSLQFTPTSGCREKIRQLRLLYKNTTNGFVLVGEKKNLGTDALPNLVPLVDIAEGTRFNFLITETDNNFINITDTDPNLFSDGKKYVFRNTDSQPAVVAGNIATITIHNNTPVNDVVTLAPRLFTAPVVVADNPVKLVFRGSEGEFVTEKIVPRDTGGNIIAGGLSLNDTPFEEGLYTLQQVDAGNAVVSEKKYFLFDPVTGVRVNGIVQITYNTILVAQAKKEIHISIHLNPRSVHWVYKVDIEKYEDPLEFLNKRIKPADLKVDTTSASPAVGTPFTRTILFSSINPADWFINDKVQFRSNNPIPLKKTAYEKLQLLHTTVPVPVIISNLPNPNPLNMEETIPNTYEIEMFLKVK